MIKKRVFLLLLFQLVAFCASAVELPSLPADPVFHCGVLPNGVSWYIAVNNSTKARADFVLVQRCGMQLADSTGNPVTIAKDALASLPHFRKVSPQKFLTGKGATPDRNGFVQVTEDATVFRFNDILLTDDKAVTDSTLLLLFDIVGGDVPTPFKQKWYAPSDQAIVISGDVDPDKIIQKLYYFSLMTNAGESQPRPEYKWVDSSSPLFHIERCGGCVSSVSVSWRMPRTPYEYMNTIQPAIFEMVVNELGFLVAESIRANMNSIGIPVADIKWEYVPSSATVGDEKFTMSMITYPSDIETAMIVMASTFSSIARGETKVRDFVNAKKDYVASLASQIAFPLKDNRDYTDRAVSSFLYNSSLASVKEKYDFYNSRAIADTLELRLFNNIASALLSDRDNISVVCRNPREGFSSDNMKSTFQKAWETSGYKPIERTVPSSVYASLPQLSEKLKVSTKYDNSSESFVWTFSNGFTVVYKKMPTERNLFYSLSLSGGYGNLQNLIQGEGGFVSDYLKLCRINGIKGGDFFRALQEEGVYMQSNVSLSEMSVSGVAPVSKVSLALNALVSVFNNRENDQDAFDSFYKEQKLASVSRNVDLVRLAKIDSIICPDNKYTFYKNIDALTPDFMVKADQFYRRQSQKMDDGVLVLVGDMDENRLKKILMGYAGQFGTARRACYRSTYRYQPISGTSIYTVKSDNDGIDVVMSAMYPLSAENDLAVRIAGMVLRRRLSDALADTGMYLDVSSGTTIYPQERINIAVSARLADSAGFASGVVHSGPIKALSVMRSCLNSMAEMEVSAEELAIYKEYVKGQLLVCQQNPAWWLDVISRRYIQGKDMYTKILNKLEIISPEKINSVLSALSKGSRVEYVTKDVK